MCGFLYFHSVLLFSHAHQLEKLPEKTWMPFEMKSSHKMGKKVSSKHQAGEGNRFENNQNKKHYHFTIRRTQTRCLMNHITISSDSFSLFILQKSCGRKKKILDTRKMFSVVDGGRDKSNFYHNKVFPFLVHSLSNETSNFLFKMKSLWKYEKFDKQIGTFYVFHSEIV